MKTSVTYRYPNSFTSCDSGNLVNAGPIFILPLALFLVSTNS